MWVWQQKMNEYISLEFGYYRLYKIFASGYKQLSYYKKIVILHNSNSFEILYPKCPSSSKHSIQCRLLKSTKFVVSSSMENKRYGQRSLAIDVEGDPWGYEIDWRCNVSQNVWDTPRDYPTIYEECVLNQRTGNGWMVIILIMLN